MAIRINIKAPRIKIRAPKIKIKPPNFKPVLKTAGRITGDITGFVKRGQNKIKKLPVVGTPVSALFDWTHGYKIQLIGDIAKGKRIDRAVYNSFKRKVKAGQDLAPYAQTIVSTVPGVGPGVSGALGAANALSKGRRIDEALYEGVKDSIPGGPAARAAFEISYALATGKNPTQAAVAALPVGPVEKRLITQGIGAVQDIAKGKKLNETLVNRGIQALPNADARRAAQIGIALAEGKRLQDITEQQIPYIMGKLKSEGVAIAKSNGYFKAGAETLKGSDQIGYLKGVGFMSHKATPVALRSALNSLPKDQRDGFDIALGASVGGARFGMKWRNNAKKSFGFAVGKVMSKEQLSNVIKAQREAGEKAKVGQKKQASAYATYMRRKDAAKEAERRKNRTAAQREAGEKAKVGQKKTASAYAEAMRKRDAEKTKIKKGKAKRSGRSKKLVDKLAVGDGQVSAGIVAADNESWWDRFVDWVEEVIL